MPFSFFNRVCGRGRDAPKVHLIVHSQFLSNRLNGLFYLNQATIAVLLRALGIRFRIITAKDISSCLAFEPITTNNSRMRGLGLVSKLQTHARVTQGFDGHEPLPEMRNVSRYQLDYPVEKLGPTPDSRKTRILGVGYNNCSMPIIASSRYTTLLWPQRGLQSPLAIRKYWCQALEEHLHAPTVCDRCGHKY